MKTLQNLPLELKIEKTKQRIKEWYEYWDGNVHVTFSGGKDSTVLLTIVRELYPNVQALFVDTGLEFPEIKQFVRTFDNVVIKHPKMNFKKVVEEYGYPVISKDVAKRVYEYRNAIKKGRLEQSAAYKEFNGLALMPDGVTPSFHNKTKWRFLVDAPFKISHKCCDIMKKNTAKEYEKEHNGSKPFIGTLAEESIARTVAWNLNGCNAFNAVIPVSNPLAFWREQDILEYIYTYNISIASVYGKVVKDENGKFRTTGEHRTGCIWCGFGCHLEKEPNRFQKLKKTHPKLWDYCMKPVEEHGLGLKDVLDYINVKTE